MKLAFIVLALLSAVLLSGCTASDNTKPGTNTNETITEPAGEEASNGSAVYNETGQKPIVNKPTPEDIAGDLTDISKELESIGEDIG